MRLRLLPILLSLPFAMILLLALVHFGPATVEAQGGRRGAPPTPSIIGAGFPENLPQRANAFSNKLAGTYLMEFTMGPMKFNALITLDADGGYVVTNQTGLTEQGNWEQSDRGEITGAGLGFEMTPPEANPANPEMPMPPVFKFVRNKSWTITFDDRSLESFNIAITAADKVLTSEDPLDSSLEGEPLPLPTPFLGTGRRVPTSITSE